MIDIGDVQDSMEAMKRAEYLKRHPYKIWEGKGGKWYTYLPDDKKGRVQRERNSQVFNRHYGEFGRRRIKSVSMEGIEDFLEEQVSEKELTAKAFSNLKTITRGLLKRAKKRKLISFNVEELFQDLDTSETDFKKVIKEDYEEVFSEDEMPVMV